MERDEALRLLHQYVKNPRMIAHSLASEAVLRTLALRLGENPDKWAIAGLLHDLDVEITEGNMHTHAMESARILKEKGLPDDIVEAIMLHNENASHGRLRSTPFQHALAAGETITGLITATALVYPDKKVTSVKPKSVAKRMKERGFAASVNRETIMECETIGIPLAEFIDLSLNAMKEIAAEIGL